MIKRWGWLYRGNRYGLTLETMWPHISLGISAHISIRWGHLTIHLPVGYVIVGCLGADRCEAETV